MTNGQGAARAGFKICLALWRSPPGKMLTFASVAPGQQGGRHGAWATLSLFATSF